MQHSSACFRWTMKHGKLCKMSNWRFFLEKHNAKNTLDLNFCMRHTSSSDYIEIALVELISCAKCIFTYTSFGFNIIWQIYTHKNQLMLHNFTKSESQWALAKEMCFELFSFVSEMLWHSARFWPLFIKYVFFGQSHSSSIFKWWCFTSTVFFIEKNMMKTTEITAHWTCAFRRHYGHYNDPVTIIKMQPTIAEKGFFLTLVKYLEIAYFCIPNHEQRWCKSPSHRIHRTHFIDESSMQQNVEKRKWCVICIGVCWIEIYYYRSD